MDRFKQLETFVNAATLGSLSAAARAEGVVPALIGRRLDALETRLGLKLLVRSTRRLSLTAEGERFLASSRAILESLEDAESEVAVRGAQASGRLRITAPAGFGRRHVAPLLPALLDAHPALSVSLDLTDRVVDLRSEGYDCAIRLGELEDSSLVGVRLGDNRRVVVGAPAYLARHGRPAHPSELAQHNCLSLGGAGQARGWLFAEAGKVVAHRVDGDMGSSDGAVLHAWALAGRGLAWRSMWEVSEDLAHGRLASVLDEFAAPPNGIYAVFPQRKHLPARVHALVDLLRDTYRENTYWTRAQTLP
jgi:DNA-binding transcriptional LysR family regulator